MGSAFLWLSRSPLPVCSWEIVSLTLFPHGTSNSVSIHRGIQGEKPDRTVALVNSKYTLDKITLFCQLESKNKKKLTRISWINMALFIYLRRGNWWKWNAFNRLFVLLTSCNCSTCWLLLFFVCSVNWITVYQGKVSLIYQPYIRVSLL